MNVTFCRAASAKDERGEIRGADYLAELFLTDEARTTIANEDSCKWTIKNILTSALYGYFVSRTAYIDDVFQQALSGNFSQIVFLGAGYDTRSYRYREILNNTRIFELDIDSTQKNKIDILTKSKIIIPEQVSFLSINFKSDSIEDVLLKAGFNSNAKTLFIWEGVTYYLQKEVIINTIQFIHRHSARGSLICFDYLTEQIDSINPAEPFLFWMMPDEISTLLLHQGFEIIENVNPHEMKKRYLTLNDGSLAEKVLPFFHFITAMVTK
jgi:methyltransferase, putative, TIGR00027 family